MKEQLYKKIIVLIHLNSHSLSELKELIDLLNMDSLEAYLIHYPKEGV